MFLNPSKKEFGPEKYWENILSRKRTLKKSGRTNDYLKKVSQFTPYQNNGGTVVALATKDYCIVASDTRFTNGFAIPSRNISRIIKVSPSVLLATAGMQSDLLALQHEIKEKVEDYQNKNEKNFSITNCSFYLSSLLYSKRFFPFFTFNILSGLDKNGEGSNFSFDAIGSFEKNNGSCRGKGEQLIQNLLDTQTLVFSPELNKKSEQIINQAALLKNYFLRAVQRGISIGDGLQVFILTRKGVLIENNILRVD